MTEEDVARVLMAICTLEGIWQNEMRIPLPGRILLIERQVDAAHRWRLNERGYPAPSRKLMREIEQLARQEKERGK